MARLTKALCTVLVLMIMFGFKKNTQVLSKQDTLLVLTDVNNENSFSKFKIQEENGVLVGYNVDEYPVRDGIYRIQGSSNDKYYNHNILIQN